MKRQPERPTKKTATQPRCKSLISDEFDAVLQLIVSARQRAFKAVNFELIDLYWSVGGYVSSKVASAAWGRKTIETLSAYIQKHQPGIRGGSASNIWRMRQFFETYEGDAILAPLVRELGWTQHLIVMSRCKQPEEREFYLRLASREGWGKRELDRQINSSLFARTVLSPAKLSPVLRETQPSAAEVFKDSYMLEFLGLPEDHSEADLHHGLLTHLSRFITELDRDIKKPHENPSIGVLLCASKDSEVVEYALSRSLSPALIAEYQTQLPDRSLLQRKLHEFYEQLAPAGVAAAKPREKR